MRKVSIIMSVFNKGDYLRQAIQSILDQSFPDFELIIRDNQSGDDSVEIIRSFTDPRINFEQNSRNVGPGESLNRCIESSSGDYLAIAHGDDVWDCNFLSVNLDLMEEHTDVNVSHSLTHTIDRTGNIRHALTENNIGDYQIIKHDEVLKGLFKGCFVKTPTIFMRRCVVRYFDLRYIYTGDWDMFLKIAAEGNDFMFINKPLVYYRVTSNSETAVAMKNGDLVMEDYLTLRNFFSAHPAYQIYRQKSLRRLSGSILRRARDTADKQTLYQFLWTAVLSYPPTLINPAFHLYYATGTIFGPKGLQALKKVSKIFTRLLKGARC